MNPNATRIFGLSARGRRLAVPFLVAMVVVIAVGSYFNQQPLDGSGSGTGPIVGGDLHAVGQVGDRLFVGGHGGAGFRSAPGAWTQIESLANTDVMGWATSDNKVLAGGHAGLYLSTNQGSSFEQVPRLPVSDVHALGAVGKVVYLASPQQGMLVSTDGGNTFQQRSTQGQDFMGTIWVNPSNPNIAIAPSMQSGAVKTTDGGRTWTAMGSGMGSMSVAVSKAGRKLFVIGMGAAQTSSDGGSTWSAAAIPSGASAAFYTSDGRLIVGALAGDQANVYEQSGINWTLLP